MIYGEEKEDIHSGCGLRTICTSARDVRSMSTSKTEKAPVAVDLEWIKWNALDTAERRIILRNKKRNNGGRLVQERGREEGRVSVHK